MELRVVSSIVWRKKDGSLPDPEPVFLTSPVAPDLERIKGASGFGRALASYLGDSEAPGHRVDLRNDRETVLNGVRPDTFPLARWPSEVGKPLAVSQQFAVNTILAEQASGGLFSRPARAAEYRPGRGRLAAAAKRAGGSAHQRGQQVRDAQQRADQLGAQVAAAREWASGAARNAEALIGRRVDGEQRVRRAREAWGPAFPDNWLRLDQDEQELAAPWSDEEWTGARTRVFLAALDLHRAFVAGAAKTIRRNLRQLVAALAREPGAPPPDAELVAWQTLFLLIPVISTTFASCGRMFGALGAGSLGWVLVDEAGQAVPQHAAGALWRARRAVIVGDPLQLEPIFHVPGQVQDRLRACSVWTAPGCRGTSAQGMADRHNRWGTEITVENRNGDMEKVWVGAPLRVHRRCEQPMFGIGETPSPTRASWFTGPSPGFSPAARIPHTRPAAGST